MSASASKKKRKELEEQGLSPKDVAAKKEKEKKNKLLRNLLIVALAVVVCLAAVFAVIKLVNRPSYDTKAALATAGEEKITVPVYDYFYNLTASNLYNSYSFLFTANTPLSEQQSLFGEGTMEDYIKDTTNSTLREVLNVVAKAKEAGYKLTDEMEDEIDESIDAIKSEASTYGYPNVDKYLKARFGEGCDLDSYEDYIRLYMTYYGYGTKLQEDFQPTAEELKAAYEANKGTYDFVNFTYATSAAESTPVETEEDADADADDDSDATKSTETTYTAEAKAAAKEQAESYRAELPEDATTTSYTQDSVTSYFNEEIANWLFDESRKEGDVEVFAKNEDEIYFYTVRFDSRDTNEYHRINANVITIAKDKEDAEIAEGQQTAEQKRDALIAAVKDGMTDEEFSDAVATLGYTASVSSLTKTYSVEEVRDFLFAEGRKAGDMLTSYENDSYYYVVRYVSEEEDLYRDVMVKSDLWTEYYEGIATANELTINEDMMQYAHTDLTFYDNSSSNSES